MLFDTESYEPLHNRNISVTTHAYDKDAIALEGRLTDNRFVDVRNAFGEYKPSGIVHDMIVQMIIRGPKMIIEAVDVQMKATPHKDCPQVENSLTPLVGERISSGFTSKVHQLVGGKKGCAHLVALCRAMASAAVQGAYSLAARDVDRDDDTVRHIRLENMKHVIDTCHLWRSDGPIVKRLKEKLDKGQQ